MEPHDVAPGRFSVAFVCSGNRFRSVIAEAAFREATRGLPVSVESYGTLDVGPAEPLPAAVRGARAFDLDISTHVARCLSHADLTETSLVLGFEVKHVLAAIDHAGAQPQRAFALLELVELLDRTGVAQGADATEQAVESVSRAHAGRRSERRRRSVLEIEDPVGLRASGQRAIGQTVYHAANTLALQLFGARELSRRR